MIETIHCAIFGFIVALAIYSFYDDRTIVQLSQALSFPLFGIYYMGYEIGVGQYWQAGVTLLCLILLLVVAWRKVVKNLDKEPDAYKKKDLIRAQEIYYENYVKEPDVFAPTYSRNGARYHMEYILGIIDSKSKKLKQKSTLKE